MKRIVPLRLWIASKCCSLLVSGPGPISGADLWGKGLWGPNETDSLRPVRASSSAAASRSIKAGAAAPFLRPPLGFLPTTPPTAPKASLIVGPTTPPTAPRAAPRASCSDPCGGANVERGPVRSRTCNGFADRGWLGCCAGARNPPDPDCPGWAAFSTRISGEVWAAGRRSSSEEPEAKWSSDHLSALLSALCTGGCFVRGARSSSGRGIQGGASTGAGKRRTVVSSTEET